MTTLDVTPGPGAAPRYRALGAQTRMELRLALRNGEQLLLTLVIPIALLLLFVKAPIAGVPKPRIDFLMPGVLALAVMSTAFTGQAIGTGFERRYGVLRRLATTPLSRPALLSAKTIAVILVEILQVAILCAVGAALGWNPHGDPAMVVGVLLLGTACFSALGLLMAGSLRAEATLAGANLLYLVQLAIGGVAVPLTEFSDGVRHLLELLPLGAMTDGLRAVLNHGDNVPAHDWVTLAVWTGAGMLAASHWFRWDD
ncbi:MAG TPA: ABC transporter permease [Mycobacteriales bacterium]|nr:ABC transporter permease [Mycobacteriales bacterium]